MYTQHKNSDACNWDMPKKIHKVLFSNYVYIEKNKNTICGFRPPL